jgi:hypothetical protein
MFPPSREKLSSSGIASEKAGKPQARVAAHADGGAALAFVYWRMVYAGDVRDGQKSC